MRRMIQSVIVYVAIGVLTGLFAQLIINSIFRNIPQTITITEKDIHELKDDNPADREKIAEIKKMLADTNGWIEAEDISIKISDPNASITVNGKKVK